MKVQAGFEYIQKLLSNLAAKTLLILHRFRLALILTVSLITIAALPEIFSEFFYDTRAIKTEVHKILNSARVAVSIDGISYSFYRGIILHRLRVSADANFSSGRIITFAERVVFPVQPWKTLVQKEKPSAFQNIILQNAVLNFWLPADKMKDVSSTIADIVNSAQEFEIEFQNSRLQLFLEKSSYDKHKIVINEIQGKISQNASGRIISVSYADSVWGNGQLKLRPAACFPFECGLDNADIFWSGNDFSLNQINWWFTEYVAESGKLSGKFEINRQTDAKPASSKSQIDLDLEIQSLNILNQEKPWFNVKNASLLGTIELTDKLHSYDLAGQLNNRRFDYKWQSLPDDIWPISASITLETSAQDTIPLPGNLTLQGLTECNLKMQTENTKRTMTGSLKVENGQLIDHSFQRKPYAIDIPSLKIDLANNELKASAWLRYNDTELHISSGGQIQPTFTEYRRIAFPMLVGFEGPSEKILIFQSRIETQILSDNSNLADFTPYKIRLEEYFKENAIAGMQNTWVPSRFRDHKNFIRYAMLANLDFTLKLNNFKISDQDNLDLAGKVTHNGISLRANISDAEGKNSIILNSEYTSNVPYTSSDIVLSLKNAKPLFQNWISNKALADYGLLDMKLKFSTSGERAGAFYSNLKSWGNVKIENVKLGELKDKLDLPEKWQTVELQFQRTGTLGSIRNLIAENENFTLNGAGSWVDINLLPDYKLSVALKQKKEPGIAPLN